LKLRSVNSIVIAPARTGKVVTSKKAVTPKDQIIKGSRSMLTILVVREQIIVVIKLILPKIEEIPAMCKLKIAKSTEIPE
jgi:hypothetical protein